MGRVTGGALVIELKTDVAALKRSFAEMDRRMSGAIARIDATVDEMKVAIDEMKIAVGSLGVVAREGFADIGKSLDRFATHLEVHTDALGELTAKVNEHEDRIAALENKG